MLVVLFATWVPVLPSNEGSWTTAEKTLLSAWLSMSLDDSV